MATNLDGDLGNADWTKRTWDLHGTVAVQADLVLGDGSRARQASALQAFLQRPAARAMPTNVKQEIRKRGFVVP